MSPHDHRMIELLKVAVLCPRTKSLQTPLKIALFCELWRSENLSKLCETPSTTNPQSLGPSNEFGMSSTPDFVVGGESPETPCENRPIL